MRNNFYSDYLDNEQFLEVVDQYTTEYRKDLKRNFVSAYVQSKHMTEHVESQMV